MRAPDRNAAYVMNGVTYGFPIRDGSRLAATAFGSAELTADGAVDVAAMHAMARGRRDALTALYERYGGLAHALALRTVHDAGAAEEIVQDAFIALWRNAARYREDRCSPRTWIFTIVRNRAIDELRRRGRDARSANIVAEQPNAIEDDPWPEFWKAHCGDAIRDALDNLSPEQRRVVELGFFAGLTHSEIAIRLNAPLGTVKKRMRSGLQRLRVSLHDAFTDSMAR